MFLPPVNMPLFQTPHPLLNTFMYCLFPISENLSIHTSYSSQTSISINKYMQKAGEPENDAGFPKHNYSQLNCSCYSTPLSLDYSVFRLHIYGISKWLHTTATARVKARYLYCVYALVGGAISIRDPYICAVSRVCAKESHAVFHRPVVCAVKT